MRVLLDENADSLLKELFAADLEVSTVRERGWNGKENGDLLRLAEREFDALVTMDRNLEHQQNLSGSKLVVVVLRARSNAYPVVALLVPKLNEALRPMRAGEVIRVAS